MSTKARRAEIERRRVSVASLLTARVPYRQIAAQLDISIATVSRDVAVLLAQWAKEQHPEDRNRWRATELMKLDEMEMGLTKLARQGHEGAVDRTLRIMERRAKLLGLDEPIKWDMRIEDLDAAIERELARLAGGSEAADVATLAGEECAPDSTEGFAPVAD